MLIHLDFGDNVFAQILSSFAVPRTKMPALELHGTSGTVSISTQEWYNANGPVDIFIRDESPLGIEDWQTVAAAGGEPARQPDRGRRARTSSACLEARRSRS